MRGKADYIQSHLISEVTGNGKALYNRKRSEQGTSGKTGTYLSNRTFLQCSFYRFHVSCVTFMFDTQYRKCTGMTGQHVVPKPSEKSLSPRKKE